MSTDTVYDDMMARIAAEMERLRALLPADLPAPDPDLLRQAAERNVVAYMSVEREVAAARQLRELRAEVRALGKRATRKPKQHGRAGQVRDAVKELVEVERDGFKVTARRVAEWCGFHPSRLSKSPLKELYKTTLADERRKRVAKERTTRAKSWHDAVGDA